MSLRISTQTLTIPFPSPYYSTFSSLPVSYHNEYGFMADVTATIARCGYGPSCAMTRRKRDPGKSFTLRTVPIVIPARDTVTLSHKLRDTPAVSITLSQPTKPPHPVASTSSSVLPSPFPLTVQSLHFQATQAGNSSQRSDLHREKGRS